MLISIIDLTVGSKALSREEVIRAVRAVNRQLREDFRPYWHIDGQLRLDPEAPAGDGTRPHPGLRGDGIIYLMTSPDQGQVLGYHERHHEGVPFGFVFTDLSEQLGERWEATLSHEALELIADPDVNLLCKGPHPDPAEGGRDVFHWFELCDAVQGETYELDGVPVSNFVLPAYFTGAEERGGHNDFLSTRSPGAPKALLSFGTNPGGYAGFFDPVAQTDQTRSDPRAHQGRDAKHRAEIKERALAGLRLRRRDRRPLPHPTEVSQVLDATVVSGEGDASAPATFESFAVRVGAGPKRPARDAAAGVVTDVLGPGWKADPFGGGGDQRGDFELTRAGGEPLSTSAAWDLAYRLRAHRDVVHADPLFVVPPSGPEGVAPPAVRASGLTDQPLPGAQKDCEWSVSLVKARQAWALLPEGPPPGTGVVVGHPDTGYTRHPEVLSSLDLAHEMDFVDGGAATDSLDSGLLLMPSHGTGTASVIASGAGSPTKQAAFVTGIAPGAKVMPIRVSRSVVHLSMSGVTKAIRYATEQGCHVISMSLGGPFGWWFLHDAVRDACNRGVIVLAAAGNYVGLVVYPAAFDEVIAVAGCNVELRPWRGSSHGDTVDITAPGESVWRAETNKSAAGELVYDVKMGSGTSYAVATLAGAAALWLARHGRQTLIDKYGAAGVPSVFKDLLASTCQRPDGWDTGRYGKGILDAHALLAAPLPPAAPARGMRAAGSAVVPAVDASGLRKVRHLFEDVEPIGLRSALCALLSVSDGALDRRLDQVGDELTMHLTLSPALRDEVRALAARLGPPPAAVASVTRAARDWAPANVARARASLARVASKELRS